MNLRNRLQAVIGNALDDNIHAPADRDRAARWGRGRGEGRVTLLDRGEQ